jgi:hypothetical protein
MNCNSSVYDVGVDRLCTDRLEAIHCCVYQKHVFRAGFPQWHYDDHHT